MPKRSSRIRRNAKFSQHYKPTGMQRPSTLARKKQGISRSGGLVLYKSFHQMPYPPRFRLSFVVAGRGTIAAGQPSLTTCQAYMNSAYLPVSQVLGGVGNWPGLIGGASLTTMMPGGLTTLLNTNAYNHGRVLRSRISVLCCPSSAQDTMVITITPSKTTGIPSSVAQAEMEPFTKRVVSQASQLRTCSNSITQQGFFGVRKAAIEDDLSGNYTFGSASLPTIPVYWKVNMETQDNSTNAGTLNYEWKITYWVELYDFAYANIKET